MAGQVGADIRALRKARGITLQALCAAVGRSVGWLSQVERGLADPSVRDLGLIADQLGVNTSLFFRSLSDRPEEEGHVLRNDNRIPIGSRDSGLIEELLSPTLGGTFEMIRSVFEPGAESGGPRPSHDRENGGLVLSGRLTLQIDGTAFDLGPGDSFQFAGGQYAWRNVTDEQTVVVWVVSPPIY